MDVIFSDEYGPEWNIWEGRSVNNRDDRCFSKFVVFFQEIEGDNVEGEKSIEMQKIYIGSLIDIRFDYGYWEDKSLEF